MNEHNYLVVSVNANKSLKFLRKSECKLFNKMNVEESLKLKEAALPDDDESCADNSCILLEKDLTTIEIDDTVVIVDSEEVAAGESRDEGEIFELKSRRKP